LEEALSIRVRHLNPENGTATDEVNKEMANEIGGRWAFQTSYTAPVG